MLKNRILYVGINALFQHTDVGASVWVPACAGTTFG